MSADDVLRRSYPRSGRDAFLAVSMLGVRKQCPATRKYWIIFS